MRGGWEAGNKTIDINEINESMKSIIEINEFDEVLARDISKTLYGPAREESRCSASLCTSWGNSVPLPEWVIPILQVLSVLLPLCWCVPAHKALLPHLFSLKPSWGQGFDPQRIQ